MKKEFSAGGIVLRLSLDKLGIAQDKFSKDNVEVLLIKAGSLRDRSKKHWKFPKGNIDKGESSKDAAIREVKEETGIDSEILQKAGDSKYIYSLNGEKIFKIVIYFLMEYVGGDLKPQEGEIEEVGWFEPDEVLKMLSFSADKKLLEKALEIYGQ